MYFLLKGLFVSLCVSISQSASSSRLIYSLMIELFGILQCSRLRHFVSVCTVIPSIRYRSRLLSFVHYYEFPPRFAKGCKLFPARYGISILIKSHMIQPFLTLCVLLLIGFDLLYCLFTRFILLFP